MSANGRVTVSHPLSPSSPPEIEPESKKRRRSEDLPNSPVSPPFMYVAAKSHAPSIAHPQSTDEMPPKSSPRSPNSSSSYTQVTQRTNKSMSTPASSVVEVSSSNTDDIDQHRDKRVKREENDVTDDVTETNSIARATNHERDQKLKQDDADLKECESKAKSDSEKNVPAASRLELEQVHKDMGDAFLLCRSTVDRQYPDPSKHLLAMYGLSPLLQSVARTDPLTGEKINKLRKSYEGQIKQFRLAGRNKPVKSERNIDEDEPGPLRKLATMIAEESWQDEHAKNKIEVNVDFRGKLRRAMELQPGTVRNNAHWEDVLGHEKSRPGPPPNQPPPPPQSNSRTPNGSARPNMLGNAAAAAELRRQTRGKKRSYGDDSFVGYGEGYSDAEDHAPGDYGDEDGAARRKRKRDSIGGSLVYGQYSRQDR